MIPSDSQRLWFINMIFFFYLRIILGGKRLTVSSMVHFENKYMSSGKTSNLLVQLHTKKKQTYKVVSSLNLQYWCVSDPSDGFSTSELN